MSVEKSRRYRTAASAIGLLLVGGIIGNGVASFRRPVIETAPIAPVAINRLPQSRGPVTVKARVAEVFGHDAILDDGTGRILVELGHGPDRDGLLTVGRTLTAQGRFGHGVLHARFVVAENGDVVEVEPPPPPHHHRHGPPDGRDGSPPPDGPKPPPPPPGADHAQPIAPSTQDVGQTPHQ
ncbi:hypothetical protein J2D73_04965 [Acetobacter sacchari]|uniref:Uncharacterized protein n=1 Tax=Acetobacter sacchari TaxID=2661687 RepID=A0ABS3LTB5_9PROT|nr:hypothetical protein [Acetobacter sacchari]MBO1359148.1 hypothetical protein [Acetobacter sacchari]